MGTHFFFPFSLNELSSAIPQVQLQTNLSSLVGPKQAANSLCKSVLTLLYANAEFKPNSGN